MRDVQPRKYNRLVTIEYPTTSVDSTTKEASPSFTTLCRAWAFIHPLTGKELLNANAVEADMTHRIYLYANSKTTRLTGEYRIRMDEPVSLRAPNSDGKRYFNVISVTNVEDRNRELEIIAKEQVA